MNEFHIDAQGVLVRIIHIVRTDCSRSFVEWMLVEDNKFKFHDHGHVISRKLLNIGRCSDSDSKTLSY